MYDYYNEVWNPSLGRFASPAEVDTLKLIAGGGNYGRKRVRAGGRAMEMPTEKLTIGQCRNLSARVVNHKRLTAEDRENIRLALLELANRKAKQLYGTCWDCAQRGTCKYFAAEQKSAIWIAVIVPATKRTGGTDGHACANGARKRKGRTNEEIAV